jgi:UDP-glucose 4-epimerase
MNTKKILVFGASGFIGTYLIDELLSQGHEVTASDASDFGREYYKRKNVPYINVDITRSDDFRRLENKKYDAVIHLAACQPANVGATKYDPKDYINTNVIGTLNVLEFCRQSQSKKIIYASSHRNTQDLWSANKAIQEDDGRGIKYSGEYAMFSISESAAQDCVEHYQAQYGLTGIIFRLPPVYGYGPHTEIFKDGIPVKTGFQIFIEKAMACQPLEVWGDGSVGRDIIYIKDVVSAFMKAIGNSKAYGLFNITSGKYLTLREQAETIAKLFWGSATSPQIVERPEVPNGMDSFLYDISKAKRELGWSPIYSFRDMLIDYKKESESKRYEYLIHKRKKMLGKI